jgi:hypothetical protein
MKIYIDKYIKNSNNIITTNNTNITLTNFGNDPRKRIALASSRRAGEPLGENEELSDFYVQNIQNLIDNYDDDIDNFIKNNKDAKRIMKTKFS